MEPNDSFTPMKHIKNFKPMRETKIETVGHTIGCRPSCFCTTITGITTVPIEGDIENLRDRMCIKSAQISWGLILDYPSLVDRFFSDGEWATNVLEVLAGHGLCIPITAFDYQLFGRKHIPLKHPSFWLVVYRMIMSGICLGSLDLIRNSSGHTVFSTHQWFFNRDIPLSDGRDPIQEVSRSCLLAVEQHIPIRTIARIILAYLQLDPDTVIESRRFLSEKTPSCVAFHTVQSEKADPTTWYSYEKKSGAWSKIDNRIADMLSEKYINSQIMELDNDRPDSKILYKPDTCVKCSRSWMAANLLACPVKWFKNGNIWFACSRKIDASPIGGDIPTSTIFVENQHEPLDVWFHGKHYVISGFGLVAVSFEGITIDGEVPLSHEDSVDEDEIMKLVIEESRRTR